MSNIITLSCVSVSRMRLKAFDSSAGSSSTSAGGATGAVTVSSCTIKSLLIKAKGISHRTPNRIATIIFRMFKA